MVAPLFRHYCLMVLHALLSPHGGNIRETHRATRSALSPFLEGSKCTNSTAVFPISSRNMHFWEKCQVTENILHKIVYKNGSYKNFGCDHFDKVTALLKKNKCRGNAPRRKSIDWRMWEENADGFGTIWHGRRVKFNADFKYDISFDHTGYRSPLRAGDFRPTVSCVFFCSAFKAL